MSIVLWLGLGLTAPPPTPRATYWLTGGLTLSTVPDLPGHLGLQSTDKVYSPAAPL
jgi:hypothetical protein